MLDLFWWQYCIIGLTFVWSGFVRTGLGFGGAVLALPFLLLVVDDPLIFLPIISIHLLVFSSWNAWQGHRSSDQGTNIDWNYLGRSLKVMIVPKLIGVFGLLTLPNEIMSMIIFGIVCVYSVGYILNRPFKSSRPWMDNLFLILGGYVSGTSLISAPLVIAVYSTHVARHQLRDTLFVLWFILVVIKMASFIIAGVDLQLVHQLWLFPCALVGHALGVRLHAYLQRTDAQKFYQILGSVLLVISVIGITRTLLT
ncbi:MAG TPA: sulfite exporter TauE/SafE family protein [Marinobacterium sp.]|nr:sulfite exporter TauE/SafE family protein [Marinobacterium sp.]